MTIPDPFPKAMPTSLIRNPLLPKASDKLEANVALLAPDRPSCSHGELTATVNDIAQRLSAFGIGRGDCVATVVPNGSEMAALFFGVTAVAGIAPLNPSYTSDEFRFYLQDLGAKALICPVFKAENARQAAGSLGIPVLELRSWHGRSNVRDTLLPSIQLPSDHRTPNPILSDDVVLYLHTSGTTARPKLVGLTLANIEASVRNIAQCLLLRSVDRSLCMMPLFHIHGLIAALAAPLSVGGSAICAPRFDVFRFFGWLKEHAPTWYSAVPSMHQAILARASTHSETIKSARLRFVRSSSAALAPTTLKAIADTFHCPVVEAYGMTEAAHQMTSNRLGDQRPGAVGWATGIEVAILDTNHRPITNGEHGEVAVRGPSIHNGYLNAAEENQRAFANGWFRTGDKGFLSTDGCLTITGRLKEIINRAGEKIAPLEIDHALAQHEAVVEGIAFAIPHKMLGEEVAAAIVLKAGATASADQIRGFLYQILAPFKVPREMVFVDEIPKGPTGKIQRVKLASQLGFVDGVGDE